MRSTVGVKSAWGKRQAYNIKTNKSTSWQWWGEWAKQDIKTEKFFEENRSWKLVTCLNHSSISLAKR
mgnify:CR=1 FL=1